MVFHVRGTAGIAAFLPGWGSTGEAPGEPVQPGAEVLSGRRLSYGQIGCSCFGLGFVSKNHYPRFRGAPFGYFRTLTRRPPSVDSGLIRSCTAVGSGGLGRLQLRPWRLDQTALSRVPAGLRGQPDPGPQCIALLGPLLWQRVGVSRLRTNKSPNIPWPKLYPALSCLV